MESNLIYVLGGAGSIGSELVRQLAMDNPVVVFDTNETGLFDIVEELVQKGHKVSGHIGDVREYEQLIQCVQKFGKPKTIFMAAALKHVSPSAWNPEQYVRTNILGTLNAIRLADETGAKLVNTSTDKVVNANSIMGATKKVAEIAVKNAGYVSVRFGNVLGSRGSLIPIIQRQLNTGEPITITDERMTRYFMSIEEACSLLIKAAEYEGGSTLIMDMGEKKNVLQLAKEILNKAGKPDYEIKMIGMRPGETLTEELMSKEEEVLAVKEGNFWILK